MSGILAKAVRGAADVAVPALIDKAKQDVIAKREERLRQYQTQARGAEQQYRTSEREASQDFMAGENEKNRQNMLNRAAITAKTKGKEGQVPEYEKILRKMSVDTFNSSLGDAYNFEGNNADKAAQLAQRSVEIYKGMESPDTTVAYQQALKELRTQENTPSEDEIRALVEKEAKQKGGFKGPWDANDFGGVPREDWITNQVDQRMGILNGAMTSSGGGASSAGGQQEAPPMPGAEKAKDGKWYVKQNGKWYEVTQ